MTPTYHVELADCRDYLRTLPDCSVDSVITSPPYAMQRASLYGGIPEREYHKFTVQWFEAIRKALKPAASVLLNIREHVKSGQISDYVLRTRLALREAGWVECDELIWIKPDSAPVGRIDRPRRSWERILWFSKSPNPICFPKANGNASDRIGGSLTGNASKQWKHDNSSPKGNYSGTSRQPDFFVVRVAKNEATGHPAAYPVDLCRQMCRLVTPPGGTVLDPFTGSGSTGKAAMLEGFSFLGSELQPEYHEIALARIKRAQWEYLESKRQLQLFAPNT